MPQRWFLALVFMCVMGLMVAMMVRAIEFKARTASTAAEAASADQDDDRPRIPLPAGPRRFQ